MIKKVFTVYDVKAECYMDPFMFTNKGEAIRGFTDLLKEGKSMIAMHPEDFTLFYIADFDTDKGTYKSFAPVSLGAALEFMPVVQKELDNVDLKVVG